jgi:hypothetical protein
MQLVTMVDTKFCDTKFRKILYTFGKDSFTFSKFHNAYGFREILQQNAAKICPAKFCIHPGTDIFWEV